MSRQRDNYQHSFWRKFRQWVDGEVDTLTAERMESVAPVPQPETAAPAPVPQPETAAPAPVPQPETAAPAPVPQPETAAPAPVPQPETAAPAPVPQPETAAPAPVPQPETAAPASHPQPNGAPALSPATEGRGLRLYNRFYQIMSVLLCMGIILVLLWTIAYLPVFGNAGNPDNNEVSARYIEQGLKETGAMNMVTGMILDYRAFDTFGESCVLFIASCCVLVLLRVDTAPGENPGKKKHGAAGDPAQVHLPEQLVDDRIFEPKNDIILQKCATVLVPVILMFGVYIILNGHLSPGGGFSGGAVMGSGLILYLNAFGFRKTERFFNEKVYRRITVSALTFYCLAKSYSSSQCHQFRSPA